MIHVLRQGSYKLIETKAQTRILILDGETYAWMDSQGMGDILVATHNPHKTGTVLALGPYTIYAVEDEPELTDEQHLELLVGEDAWQSYLLPTGLPDEEKRRSRVVSTKEIISSDNSPLLMKGN